MIIADDDGRQEEKHKKTDGIATTRSCPRTGLARRAPVWLVPKGSKIPRFPVDLAYTRHLVSADAISGT